MLPDRARAAAADPAVQAPHPPRATGHRPPGSVVVVGAGLAGGRAVAALRGQGFDGRLTVLGAEGLPPYDRPPLSKELLTRAEPAWLDDEIGGRLGEPGLEADLRLAEPALGLTVDATGVSVRTAAGEVRADAAVLASGAHAVLPAAWSRGWTLHTAADAARLRAAVGRGTRLVVVGAGWIGAEVAGVAAGAGADVTVVEAADAPLAAALSPAVGALTAAWYPAAGVRLLTGARVVEVDQHAVTLADGRVLEADVVLVAVGARPSSGWLEGAVPLTATGAVQVDPAYRVLGRDGPLDHVVAVGDLATRRSPRHGWVPGGHWDGALRGPDLAVHTLLAGARTTPPDPAPYVFSTQLGHELALLGQPGLADDVVLRGAAGDAHAREADGLAGTTVLWFRAGTDELTAVLAVDRPRDVSAARRLFGEPGLPRLDRTASADPATRLRDALR